MPRFPTGYQYITCNEKDVNDFEDNYMQNN